METDYFLTKDFKNWYIEMATDKAIALDRGCVGPTDFAGEVELGFHLFSDFSVNLSQEDHEIDGYYERTTYEINGIDVYEFEVMNEDSEVLDLDYLAIIKFLENN